MPELPEVETIKRRLLEILPGKSITRVQVLHQKSFQGFPEQLVGSQIVNVSRRAKVLSFHLSNNFHLLTHLKMTGQLIVIDQQRRIGGGHPDAAWTDNLPNSHTRIIYTFNDDVTLYFNDQRTFGWMKQVDQLGLESELSKYGPDIIDPLVTTKYLMDKIIKKSISIKQVLMDSAILAGVGNIYASEICFLAKIDPRRKARTLSRVEIDRLLEVSKKIIWRAIDLGGTTFDGKYVDVDGLAGKFQHELQVYGQEANFVLDVGSQL